HAALREYPGDLGDAGPAGELRRMLDLVGDARLRERAEQVVANLPDLPVQALHGDAHAGNLLATPDGPRWVDFEDTWRGPLAWALACLARTTDTAAYPVAVPGVPEFLALRTVFAVGWRFVIARRFPDRLGEAEAALAAYLG